MRSIFSVVVLATVTLMVIGQETPLIHTQLGDILGVAIRTRNEHVYQFRSIPYAKSPTGDLRFAKPLPHGPWAGVFDGTKFGPSCMQPIAPAFDKYLPNLNQSEDCLQLNVYVPRNLSRSANRPVMVWIHGGGFSIGQGMLYDGSFLALTGDVIVITINYRLGAFGFLSTLSRDLPGNYGLWDQRLALEWVQRNIRSFGGNPDAVTLFGESAGGFSVALHSILPQNKGLFRRVIAQSGAAESPFSTWKDPKKFSKEIGKSVGCADRTSQLNGYVECMRRIPAGSILDAQNNIMFSANDTLSFDLDIGPVIDGDFLPFSPDVLLSKKTSSSYKFFQTLDFVSGNVNSEASLFLGQLSKMAKEMHFNYSRGIPTNIVCNRIVPEFLKAYFEMQINSTLPTDLICSVYFPNNQAIQGNNVLDVYSDVFFIIPALKGLQKHADNNTQSGTYQYIFNRPTVDPDLRDYPPWWLNGSSPHGSELLFVFGLEDLHTKLNFTISTSDIHLSKQMMEYWTNFAKNGNPNSAGLPVWEAFDMTNENYINFNTIITPGQHLHSTGMDLWLNQLPKLVHSQDPNLAIGKK